MKAGDNDRESLVLENARDAALSKFAKDNGEPDAPLVDAAKIPYPFAGLALVNPVNDTAGHVLPHALAPIAAPAVIAEAVIGCRAYVPVLADISVQPALAPDAVDAGTVLGVCETNSPTQSVGNEPA